MADRPIIFSAPMICALLEGRKTMTRRVLRAPRRPLAGALDFELQDDGLYAIANATGCLAKVPEPYSPGDRLWVKEAWRAPKSLDAQSGSQIAAASVAVLGTRRPRVALRYEADPRSGFSDEWRVFDGHVTLGRYRHARFMPRWASRLTLIVEDVKVERLQDISEADALAEGASSRPNCVGYRNADDGWSMDWSPVGTLSRWANIPPGGPSKAPLSEGDIALGTPQSAFVNFWVRLHGANALTENPYVAAIAFRAIRANIDTLDAAGAPRREEAAHV